MEEKEKTLDEFLQEYDATSYVQPSYTADVLLLSESDGKARVLLVKRANHPYKNCYALPGGFVNENESAEEASMRELCEETGIFYDGLEQLVTVSTPKRDPRWWTVTTVFLGVVSADVKIIAGDDASQVDWWDIDYRAVKNEYELILKNERETLSARINVVRGKNGKIDLNATTATADKIAFDHAKIILYALEAL